ncbi:ThuA domain-containing protein, partial [Streptomyces sp. NPDC056982]
MQAQAQPQTAAPEAQSAAAEASVKVLVFHGPADKQDDPVASATSAIRELGQKNGFSVDESDDPGVITTDSLARYRGVVFLSAEGVSLTSEEESAFQAYIKG